jgi:hypothetical protein
VKDLLDPASRSAAAISRRELFGLGAGAAALLLPGCGGGSSPAGIKSGTRNAVLQWNDAALQAVRVAKPGPPMVARMLAMTSTCIFDAWAAYDLKAIGTRLGGTLRRPPAERTAANKQKAISYAAYRTLVDLFPTQTAYFDAQMATFGYDPADGSTDRATPSGIGNSVAAAVFAFRHSDGSNQLGDLSPGAYTDYTGYVPVNDPDHLNDPNRWQPLRVANGLGGFVIQKYIGAFWGRVTPFALTSGSQFRPTIALPQAGTPEYTAQAQQLIDYSANLTDTQKLITEYFADGPNSELPPGHWYLFGSYVSQRDAHDMDTDVKMFFTIGNAVMDAGIACWDTKRAYDSVRPISAIHYAFKGQTIRAWGGPFAGTVSLLGENFGTFQAATVVTPAFPEFPSGHSTFSASAAEALKRFTGSDAFGFSVTFPVGSSPLEPGTVPSSPVTLSFPTFSDAADAAGISRRYGGIHFETGDLMGRAMGRSIGVAVWDRAQAYINGTA